VKFPALPLSTVGMGSVPYKRGEDSSKVIFRDWDIPFWPQYPARSLRENFVYQFLGGFPGLAVSDTSASFDPSKFLRSAEAWQKRLDRAFSEKEFLGFEPSSDSALGYSQMKNLLKQEAFPEKKVIKLQITGTDTVWEFFFKKCAPDERANEIKKLLKLALMASGLAEIERARSFGRIPLIFIDEPSRPAELSRLKEMVKIFKAADAFVGLHTCSQREWDGFEHLEIDFFHFDATAQPVLEASNRSWLQGFLKSGRWVVWGIIPTGPDSSFRARNFSSSLLEKTKQVSTAAIPVDAVLEHSLIAPACGTGTLNLPQDQAVRESLRLTAQSLKFSV